MLAFHRQCHVLELAALDGISKAVAACHSGYASSEGQDAVGLDSDAVQTVVACICFAAMASKAYGLLACGRHDAAMVHALLFWEGGGCSVALVVPGREVVG